MTMQWTLDFINQVRPYLIDTENGWEIDPNAPDTIKEKWAEQKQFEKELGNE